MGLKHRADLRGLGLKHRGGASDFDGLRHLTNLHGDVHARGLIKLQCERRVDGALEARSADPQGVISHRDAEDVVRAAIIRLGGPDGSALHIFCRDLGIGDGSSARICDRADDGGGDFLAPGGLQNSQHCD